MSWLSSALGQDKNDAGDPYRDQSIQNTNATLGYRPQYDQIARTQGGINAQFTPDMIASIQNYGDLLGQSATDQQRQAFIAHATRNASDAFTRGESGATSDLAARGLADSGTMAGALTNLHGQRAGAFSDAANEADQFFEQWRQQNLAKRAALYGGVTSDALHNEEGAMGAGAGLSQWGASTYGNLAQQAYQAKAQQQQQAAGALGGFLGAGGALLGGSGGRSAGAGGNGNSGNVGFGTGGTFDASNPDPQGGATTPWWSQPQ